MSIENKNKKMNEHLTNNHTKNIFEGVDHNRLEQALSRLYSSVNGVEIKVTLTPKEQKEKPTAATVGNSKMFIKQKKFK